MIQEKEMTMEEYQQLLKGNPGSLGMYTHFSHQAFNYKGEPIQTNGASGIPHLSGYLEAVSANDGVAQLITMGNTILVVAKYQEKFTKVEA